MEEQRQASPAAFLSLPREIIDDILSELDEPRELVSFALASHACAQLTIPWHTEYRIIRIRAPLPAMWEHLALRSDLARNVRDVSLCSREDYTSADRFPSTLVNPSLLLPSQPTSPTSPITPMSPSFINVNAHTDELKRIQNVCKALGHMKRLRSFFWSYEPDQKAGLSTDAVHEEMVLSAVSKAPELRHFMVRGRCGIVVRGGYGITGEPYPIFLLGGLESLSLYGATWDKSNYPSLIGMLQRSPDIKILHVPMELSGLDQCHLPRLKKLTLPMTSGFSGDGHTYLRSATKFLSNHPTIEELFWIPFDSLTFPPNFLPRLKYIESNDYFMDALEETGISRPIEWLHIHGYSTARINTSQALDAAHLQKIYMTELDQLYTIEAVAERFGRLTWLSMSDSYSNEDGYLMPIELAQWLDLLPKFPNLEVFRGQGLWNAVGGCKEQMHEVIMELVERCPNLRQLDHCDVYSKRRSPKIIKIFREHDENGVLTRAWYEVHKPPSWSWNVFDRMKYTFT